MTSPIVSPQWLSDNLNTPNILLLEASLHSGKANPDFENLQIQGTRFFDLKNEFRDKSSQFPNTLPDAKQFEAGCQKLGINKSSQIVIYDKRGIYESPRAWWLFKAMGHEKVAILDGGFPEWMKQGLPTVEKTAQRFEAGDFEAKLQVHLVKDFDAVVANLDKKDALVLDARSSGRFHGTAPEPRKELRGGCIPNSVSLPYTDVLKDGKFKSKAELTTLFKNLQIADKPLVFSCGSGITACIIYVASELVVGNGKSVYDGSWTEWAQRVEKSDESDAL